MNRTELRVALIEGTGEDRESLEADYNLGLAQFYREGEGSGGERVQSIRILGLETREGPNERFGADTHRTLRGVLTYEVTVDDPEPESEPIDALRAQEAAYGKHIEQVIRLAGEIALMREAGKNGEGMDYARLWKTVDRLGDEFRAMGGIVGGPESANDAPQDGD